jgi:hypothetical protein
MLHTNTYCSTMFGPLFIDRNLAQPCCLYTSAICALTLCPTAHVIVIWVILGMWILNYFGRVSKLLPSMNIPY